MLAKIKTGHPSSFSSLSKSISSIPWETATKNKSQFTVAHAQCTPHLQRIHANRLRSDKYTHTLGAGGKKILRKHKMFNSLFPRTVSDLSNQSRRPAAWACVVRVDDHQCHGKLGIANADERTDKCSGFSLRRSPTDIIRLILT